MLAEDEVVRHVPCAFDSRRGRMRATKAENLGYQRGQRTQTKAQYLSIWARPSNSFGTFRSHDRVRRRPRTVNPHQAPRGRLGTARDFTLPRTPIRSTPKL